MSARWSNPLPLWPGDADVRRRLRDSIGARIAHIRITDGINEGEPWQTFDPPLLEASARRQLPIGRVASLPTNVNVRGDHGRYTSIRAKKAVA